MEPIKRDSEKPEKKRRQEVLPCGCVWVSYPVYDRDGRLLTEGYIETECERHEREGFV